MAKKRTAAFQSAAAEGESIEWKGRRLSRFTDKNILTFEGNLNLRETFDQALSTVNAYFNNPRAPLFDIHWAACTSTYDMIADLGAARDITSFRIKGFKDKGNGIALEIERSIAMAAPQYTYGIFTKTAPDLADNITEFLKAALAPTWIELAAGTLEQLERLGGKDGVNAALARAGMSPSAELPREKTEPTR